MTVALLVLVPLTVGGVLAVAGRRADRAAAPVAVFTATVVLALAVAAAWTRPSWSTPFLDGLHLGLAVDGLSAVLAPTVAVVTLVVLVFAHGDLARDEARARFFGLMTVFAGAMLVAVTSTSLLPLLMAWEVMGATSYALIGYWWHEERRADAATTAFVTTRGADLGFYLAAAAAYAGSGTLDISALAGLEAPYVHLVAAGLVVAAAGKSAQLPFSFWLSRAMEGPSPVSALLHSATMVAAGAFLLLRVQPLLSATSWALPTVAVVGVATAVLLGVVAVWQRSLKQLLAASTSAQMGFVLVAAGSGSVVAGTAHLVAHAASKSLLFLAAGAWLTVLGTQRLDELRGAARNMPTVGVPFAVGALSLAGIPPLAMWVSKDLVLGAASGTSTVLWVALLAAAVVSAVYAGTALGTVLAPAEPAAARASGSMTAPLAALAVAVVVLAVVGLPPVVERLGRLLGDEVPHAPVWSVVVSSVLAVAVTAYVAVRAYRGWLPRVGAFLGVPERWLRVESLTQVVVVGPTDRLAATAARFDDKIVDGAVDGVARGVTRGAGWLLRAVEDLTVDGAVERVAGAARRLGAVARRPQTGQLHHYYAQAVVALVVLLVVALVLR